MARRKQGASLIVVTIVFMFLTTVSFGMLSMVVGNYKARVSESRRVENLYASDSGVDVVYNVLGKNFDGAVKYGYWKVYTLKKGTNTGPNNQTYKDINDDITSLNNSITQLKQEKEEKVNSKDTDLSKIDKEIGEKNSLLKKEEEFQQILIEEEFKRAFKNFIQKVDQSDENASDAINISREQLSDLIVDHSYFDLSEIEKENAANDINEEFETKTIEFGIGNDIQDDISPTFSINKIELELPQDTDTNDSETSNKKIYLSDGSYREVDISPPKEYYNISVDSTFYSEKLKDDNDSLSRTNERILEANFKLSIPQFKDIYYQEASGDIVDYLATKDRALTVKGNMNLNEADDFTVSGEVYVEGTTPSSVSVDGTIQSGINVSNRSYQKYNGGIMVYNSEGVWFKNDVVTRNTLNLRSGADVTIDTNLYGSNIYVGGSKYNANKLDDGLNDAAAGSVLDVSQVVIDNDLGVKATGSTITIDDFFGINDKTIDNTEADRVKSSSSIIVNSEDDTSSVNINKYLYIMGTAHINTNEKDDNDKYKYQTGESAAVKGNYIAYAVPDSIDTTEKFAYYDPLQLLDDSDVEDKVSYKAKHFTDYWNREINKKHYPNSGGIHLLGILDEEGNVSLENIKEYIHTVGALVYEANGEKVLGLDSQSSYGPDLELPGGAVYNKQAEFASKVYKFNQSATKFYDYDNTILTQFNSLVDTSKISSSKYNLQKQNGQGEYAIFYGDPDEEIKITTDIDHSADVITDDGIVIGNKGTRDEPDYTLNAVIVAAGNVSIKSDEVNINGCIIVGKDLNVNDKSGVKITYDSGVVERVQAKNETVFQAVFGNSIVYDNSENESDNSTSVDSSYDLKNFVEKQLWKILK